MSDQDHESETVVPGKLSQAARQTAISGITEYDDVGLATYGEPLTVQDSEITQDQNGNRVIKYDVLVDTVGRLSLGDVMEKYGLLLACSNGIEVKLAGFQDTEIALTVKQEIED